MEVYHHLCSLSSIGSSPFITIFKRSDKGFPRDDVLSKNNLKSVKKSLSNKAIFSEVAAKPRSLKLVGYYAIGVIQSKPTLVSDPSIDEGYKLQ